MTHFETLLHSTPKQLYSRLDYQIRSKMEHQIRRKVENVVSSTSAMQASRQVFEELYDPF